MRIYALLWPLMQVKDNKNMPNHIIGRKEELSILDEIFKSKKAEFLAIYGRRRIGKTYLIEEFFKDKDCTFFQITGQKDTNTINQLTNFTKNFTQVFYQNPRVKITSPSSWKEAFFMLTEEIEKISSEQRIILFFDEVPWLSSRKSNFLQELDYFWNRYWNKITNIKLIICGSAASWIINNVVNNKGGLHNRLTRLIALQPFTLQESKSFLLNKKNMNLSNAQLLEIYMAIGGIALYLEQIKNNLSVRENIDKICFQKNELLFNEFNNLFISLFDHYEIHEDIVKIISSKQYGVSRQNLLKEIKDVSSGGRINQRLQELEEAGFIVSFIPYGNSKRGIYYKLIDQYTLFYLTWIQEVKNSAKKLDNSLGYWKQLSSTQKFSVWSGYAFETICLQHIERLKIALKIESGSLAYTWRHNSNDKKDKGAQIDLLFDRTDDAITICEIKYYNKLFVIDKNYYNNILNKISVFKKVTKTKKQILIAFITKSGLKENSYSEKLGCKFITLDDILG